MYVCILNAKRIVFSEAKFVIQHFYIFTYQQAKVKKG
jgi:hypothetical protein